VDAEMMHYPREIAREIEIDKNFNLDRASMEAWNRSGWKK
jgi:hypothetical protein